MTLLPSRFVRQLLAVSLLVCALLLVWDFVVQPVLALSSDRRANIAALSGQLESLQAVADRLGALTTRERQSSTQLAAQGFWSGPSRTAMTSRMLDLLRAAAMHGGGQIVSSSELEEHPEAGLDRLGIRLRVEGSLATIVAVLSAVEASQPVLFVDTLLLTGGDAASPDRPPQLGMELAVVGYGKTTP